MTITSPKRSAVRAGTVIALTSVPLLAAGSAFATDFQGEDAGPRLSVLQTIGIFVGIPIGLFLVITLLVLLPGWMRGDRNRSEIGWDRKSAAKTEAQAPQDAQAQAAGESGEKAGAGSGTSGTGGASGSW
ncbi:MAG TPA: hypothetical protein VH372_19445 [Actinospica sp.]|nr:hypothetical protein [Actinospica sp.]